MVSSFILNIVFELIEGFFSLLPSFSWDVDNSVFTLAADFLRMIAYLLPWKTVTTILSLFISLMLFRIVVSFVKTIWDLLPIA